MSLVRISTYSTLNWRMPKCNSVLQTEKDPFQPEIRPNFSENCHFSTFFELQNPQKTFGHSPVKINPKQSTLVSGIDS